MADVAASNSHAACSGRSNWPGMSSHSITGSSDIAFKPRNSTACGGTPISLRAANTSEPSKHGGAHEASRDHCRQCSYTSASHQA